uniref:GATA transcription factor 26 n=1 Tax=Anthurium amnicola TaxID=1678845 RepID=A0A1D1Y7R6_9ARAE
MGKQGPCYHCGVTSTPLWRNGPPEKPVLCNACGSRWRTKGTLTNYMPLHIREPIDAEELKVPMIKPKEQKLHKKRQREYNIEAEQKQEIMDSDCSFWKVLEEDTNNRSTSGSAISYSESCSHFGGTDASDLTGSGQSHVWDSLVPSRKRTCITRPRPSPIEKLMKDLYILHQESSYFSGSPEEDLLYETKTPMGSIEIGHGGVLIRHLSSAALEEESEASSLPVDNKPSTVNEAYSGVSNSPLDAKSKGLSFLIVGEEKVRSTLTAQDHVKRVNSSREMFHILLSRDSSLSYVDLKEVISFEGFMRHLTQEEKHQLVKHLPSIDSANPPESLRSMFCSPQFIENLSYFRELLLEGIFDLSFSCVDVDECKTLQKLVLVNFMKSKWVEHYTRLKEKKRSHIIGRKGVWSGPNFLGSSNIMPFKRLCDLQNRNFPEKNTMIRSPKNSCYQGVPNLSSVKSLQLNSHNHVVRLKNDTDEYIENDASSSSPRSFIGSPPERSSMLDSLQFSDESSDQGLLFDVCFNASFPEAELLCNTWKQDTAMNTHSAESGIENISYKPTSSSSSQQQKHRNS